MTIVHATNNYALAAGSAASMVPIVFEVAPGPTNVNYPLGQIVIVTSTNSAYILSSFSPSSGTMTAVWTLLGAGDGDLNTLTTQDSTVVEPSSGNIDISGVSGQLTTTGSGGTVSIGYSNPSTTPGALTSTGLLTSDAGLTTSGGATTLNSGTNATNISTDASATTVHIATGAAVKTTVLGSTNTTSTTTIQSGSGGISLTGATSGTSSITSATTLTATNGNLVLGTAGNKIDIHTGANASIGQSAAMTAGTITISTTAVTASSLIFLTNGGAAGTVGTLSVGTIVAATSFVITSSSDTDTSVVNWWIIN